MRWILQKTWCERKLRPSHLISFLENSNFRILFPFRKLSETRTHFCLLASSELPFLTEKKNPARKFPLWHEKNLIRSLSKIYQWFDEKFLIMSRPNFRKIFNLRPETLSYFFYPRNRYKINNFQSLEDDDRHKSTK